MRRKPLGYAILASHTLHKQANWKPPYSISIHGILSSECANSYPKLRQTRKRPAESGVQKRAIYVNFNSRNEAVQVIA